MKLTPFPWQTGVEWVGANDKVTVECLTSEESNPCQSNPCANGGICLNAYSTFLCLCGTAWAGNTCNEPSKNCTMDNAQSHYDVFFNK